MTENQAQIDYWNARPGETWAEFQALLDRQMGPLGLAALGALAPEAGERVLDIGCGCGDTSFALAERVGPRGKVLGLDISRPMLDVARGRAAHEAVEFREADAQTEDLGAGLWDAAYSRFGVMFFADPVAAFANIRRALKRGGRLAFICWRPAAENPYMVAPLQAVQHLLPSAAPSDPLAPGPFAFQDPERVRSTLTDAGFSQIGIAPFDSSIGGAPLDETAKLALRMGPLGFALRQTPELIGVVAEPVRRRLADFLDGEAVYMDAAVWVVTATA